MNAPRVAVEASTEDNLEGEDSAPGRPVRIVPGRTKWHQEDDPIEASSPATSH